MIFLFAVAFLWGGVSLILGVTAAHVVTVLASAILGVGSALFKHASNVAVKRSDEAFKTLSTRVENAEALNRREAALARAQKLRSGDTLKTLEAIKSIIPGTPASDCGPPLITVVNSPTSARPCHPNRGLPVSLCFTASGLQIRLQILVGQDGEALGGDAGHEATLLDVGCQPSRPRREPAVAEFSLALVCCDPQGESGVVPAAMGAVGFVHQQRGGAASCRTLTARSGAGVAGSGLAGRLASRPGDRSACLPRCGLTRCHGSWRQGRTAGSGQLRRDRTPGPEAGAGRRRGQPARLRPGRAAGLPPRPQGRLWSR